MLMISVFTTMAFSSAVFAKDDHIIIQQAAQNKVNIGQAVKLKDETAVTLMGDITRHIKGEHYELKDSSGVIGIEIDDDLWREAGLKIGDHVQVIGEVDTHRYKPIDIEVIKIQKIQH